MTAALGYKGISASLSIVEAMDHDRLFRQWFPGDSWNGWRAVLRAAYALPMSASDLKFYKSVSGDRDPPKVRVRELWCACGRRAGKDSVASLIVAFSAALFADQAKIRHGERATVLLLACDREQAKIVLGYVKSYFKAIPPFAALVTNERQDGLELSNGCDIVIATNSYKSIRGRTVLCAVMDEVSFWQDETTTKSDTETYKAITPAMATLPGAMLIAISSPYARRGLLYQKWCKLYGKNDDRALCIQAPTAALNPTIDQSIIDAAMAEDPVAARADWLGEFRSDLESFVSVEAVDAVTVEGRIELAPQSGIRYVGFLDAAGGSGGPNGDSFTAAVGHREGDKVVLDAVRETRPKPTFSPEAVIVNMVVPLFKAYGINRCRGDRWAGSFPVDRCAAHGIRLEPETKTKSELYQDFLAIVNSQRCELLDHARLKAQLLGLERSVRSGGKDMIDHPRGQHDDVINAAVGALALAGAGSQMMSAERMREITAQSNARAGVVGMRSSMEDRLGERRAAQMRARAGY